MEQGLRAAAEDMARGHGGQGAGRRGSGRVSRRPATLGAHEGELGDGPVLAPDRFHAI